MWPPSCGASALPGDFPATSLYDPVGTPVELPDGSWIGSTKSGGSAGRGGLVRIEPMAPGAPNATKVSGSYSIVAGTYTLASAAANALTRGGHLAVFATDSERTSAITSLGLPTGNLWLGGSDRGVEGQWRWITGEAFTYNTAGVTPWSASEPNNSGSDPGEDGLEWLTSGLLNDLSESQTKGYVLETEIWGAAPVISRDGNRLRLHFYPIRRDGFQSGAATGQSGPRHLRLEPADGVFFSVAGI